MIKVTKDTNIFCPSCGKRDVMGCRIDIGLTDRDRKEPFSMAVTRICIECTQILVIRLNASLEEK